MVAGGTICGSSTAWTQGLHKPSEPVWGGDKIIHPINTATHWFVLQHLSLSLSLSLSLTHTLTHSLTLSYSLSISLLASDLSLTSKPSSNSKANADEFRQLGAMAGNIKMLAEWYASNNCSFIVIDTL